MTLTELTIDSAAPIGHRYFMPRHASHLIILAVILSSSAAYADEVSAETNAPTPPAEACERGMSCYELELVDYIKPFGTIAISNGLIWVGGKYILKESYADISLGSMATNLEYGFGWDEDTFRVNQLGHPYQGALYHTGARSAGLSFWQAIPYTVVGSLQWEFFMETETPAINDLITTSFGGTIMGESLYRLSLAVLDDSTSGAERLVRELVAAAINPVIGLERLFAGDIVASGGAPKRGPLSAGLSFGVERIDIPGGAKGPSPSMQFAFSAAMGDLYAPTEDFKPFDYFHLDARFVSSRRINSAEAFKLTGILATKEIGCGESGKCLLAGIQHFDFFSADIFKVATSSLGPGVYSRWSLPSDLTLNADAAVLAVVLGGFDSPHAEEVGRDYNLGQGGNGRFHLKLEKSGLGNIEAGAALYWVRTVHGARGYELAGIVRASAMAELWNGFGIELGISGYNRRGRYDDFDPIDRRITLLQLHLHWDWERDPSQYTE